MTNSTILMTIIANFREDGMPESIIDQFRIEATESGYDLRTTSGTEWYTQRSIAAEWYRSNARRTVEFSWDFEEVGRGEYVKNVYCEGIEIDGLQEFMQDNGLAAARRLVKKSARAAGMAFRETTDAGMGKDYTLAVMRAARDK